MLTQKQRSAILLLKAQGNSHRAIAKTLKVGRRGIREVLLSGTDEVPIMPREEKAEAWRDEILALLPGCRGNLVRVHEELLAQGAVLSYTALTG